MHDFSPLGREAKWSRDRIALQRSWSGDQQQIGYRQSQEKAEAMDVNGVVEARKAFLRKLAPFISKLRGTNTLGEYNSTHTWAFGAHSGRSITMLPHGYRR